MKSEIRSQKSEFNLFIAFEVIKWKFLFLTSDFKLLTCPTKEEL